MTNYQHDLDSELSKHLSFKRLLMPSFGWPVMALYQLFLLFNYVIFSLIQLVEVLYHKIIYWFQFLSAIVILFVQPDALVLDW